MVYFYLNGKFNQKSKGGGEKYKCRGINLIEDENMERKSDKNV
jgi:hypothetical protein